MYSYRDKYKKKFKTQLDKNTKWNYGNGYIDRLKKENIFNL